MTEKKYRYHREDFSPLPVTLEHMTMYLNFIDERVDATNCLTMTARRELGEIVLDARELTVHSVEWCGDAAGGSAAPLLYEYQRDQDKLLVTLPHRVKPGERFHVRTRSSCVPTDHLLEGIYKDTTPLGAPQQYMSQCQQWAFSASCRIRRLYGEMHHDHDHRGGCQVYAPDQ